MNNIAEVQNEEKYLKLQYAARYYFNLASSLNNCVWILCLVDAAIGIVASTFLNGLIFTIAILVALIGCYCQFLVQRNVKKGSAMRQYIDYHLFEFSKPTCYKQYSDEDLFRIAVRVENKNCERAFEQYNNNGQDIPPGVRDWYYNIDPKKTKNEAILECQKQNIRWDSEISSCYKWLLRIVLIIIIIIAFISVLLNNNIIALFPFIPLSVKIWQEFKIIRLHDNYVIEIQASIHKHVKISKEFLKGIQDKIDKRREMVFVPFNFIHIRKTYEMHQTDNEIKDKFL